MSQYMNECIESRGEMDVENHGIEALREQLIKHQENGQVRQAMGEHDEKSRSAEIARRMQKKLQMFNLGRDYLKLNIIGEGAYGTVW
ncbi:hypothetical protein AX774_g3900 [Zancudomyces culisetae]|uniref:Uncharacterized protein n=1 Tax=Zancudomyces culisetae TaxID=1213189 RepID=A0A1R1PNY5_ZANCU|nr:hypothetical protein AX774_g3900 [Zancudomyces culisetae]|eukprot:OMH82613.1 hypothetical protein AX774_g3900 [Zancudomyces culisetae]